MRICNFLYKGSDSKNVLLVGHMIFIVNTQLCCCSIKVICKPLLRDNYKNEYDNDSVIQIQNKYGLKIF